MTPDLLRLEARLEKLEKKNRLLQRIIFSFAGIFVLAALTGWTMHSAVPDVIEAKKFVVKNDAGKIFSSHDSSGLQFESNGQFAHYSTDILLRETPAAEKKSVDEIRVSHSGIFLLTDGDQRTQLAQNNLIFSKEGHMRMYLDGGYLNGLCLWGDNDSKLLFLTGKDKATSHIEIDGKKLR